jgi:hypothetical protein
VGGLLKEEGEEEGNSSWFVVFLRGHHLKSVYQNDKADSE